MDDKLREQFLAATIRLKKMESMLVSDCEMQINELVILMSITKGCACSKSCGTNLNVPEIQKKLHISKPAVSYILNTLEKKNYITREIDPEDRRKIAINATPQGQAAAEETSLRYDQVWSDLISGFGKDNMEQLIQLLTLLNEHCETFCSEENKKK